MAMTKEEQKAAAKRIMEKMGPMDADEKSTFEMLTKNPDEYQVPGQVRKCGVCGAEFRDILNQKGEVEIPALHQFSDHQAFHNPSPAKWSEAHSRIVKAKEAEKKAS